MGEDIPGHHDFRNKRGSREGSSRGASKEEMKRPFSFIKKETPNPVDEQIQGLKKELGNDKYNEIVVRAFVESILRESPIIKEMQVRIKELEAVRHKHGLQEPV